MTRRPSSIDVMRGIHSSDDDVHPTATEMRETAIAAADRLLVHSMEGADLPSDRCPQCRSLMLIETIEATRQKDMYQFRCRRCGAAKGRAVIRGADALSAA